jgi:glycosyltransferase involved in cell wall biosynthesis
MPPDYEVGDKLTIGYTPWESTDVPKNWIFGLKGVDDLWTTSTWVADLFWKITGKNENVFVLPHGIDDVWRQPKVRIAKRDGPFTFLHVGEPAVRKGGDIFFNAWYHHFRHRKEVSVVFKSVGPPWCRAKDSKGHILAAPSSAGLRVKVYDQVMSQQDMVRLYHQCHCLVYPSRGEGFGLIPLEAMATGLPTIIPCDGMGDFTEHAAGILQNSEWVQSTEQKIHPGKWMSHSLDELVYVMEMMIANYEKYAQFQYDQTSVIYEKFNWDAVADRAIARIQSLVP